MALGRRPEVEQHVIHQLVEGIKDVPAVLNRRGFQGQRILINALVFLAARYAVEEKRQQHGQENDWNEAVDRIVADFRSTLEEQFAYYYGIEKDEASNNL